MEYAEYECSYDYFHIEKLEEFNKEEHKYGASKAEHGNYDDSMLININKEIFSEMWKARIVENAIESKLKSPVKVRENEIKEMRKIIYGCPIQNPLQSHSKWCSAHFDRELLLSLLC